MSYVFIDQLKQQQTKTYTLHIINYMKNVALGHFGDSNIIFLILFLKQLMMHM